MDAMQPVAARVPVHTVPGNHESCWCDKSSGCTSYLRLR